MKAVLLLSAFLAPSAAFAQLCKKWDQPRSIGELETRHLGEESGLAVSKRFNRLYHVNDSGDGPYFYVTAKNGSATRKVAVEGFAPTDAEDLGFGPCGPALTCLFIADIGDNRAKRSAVELVLIEEVAEFGASVKPLRKLALKYPDGPHNAEGFAVHPNGDLFIITKEMDDKSKKAKAAQVFRLPRGKEPVAGGERPLEAWGQLDIPALLSAPGYDGLATAFDISPQGDRFVVLTYGRALEVKWDLAKGPVPPLQASGAGRDFNPIAVMLLPQMESVAYDVNGRDVLYSTEAGGNGLFKSFKKAELMRVKCLDGEKR